MPISNDPFLMRQIILDHYENPRNRGLVEDKSYFKVNLDSPNCIDNIDLQVNIKDKKIIDLKFDGVACAISTAATSILTEQVKNKTIDEALHIIDNYLNMLYNKPFNKTLLKESIVFINTYKQPNRIKCAALSWEGLKNIIIEKAGEENEKK